jgi:hypothetical protein
MKHVQHQIKGDQTATEQRAHKYTENVTTDIHN